MRHAAALLNPITWPKPFGLVMAEALATAMPVLAFPNGAEPEIIDHSQAGYLCCGEDEMTAAIARVGEIDPGSAVPPSGGSPWPGWPPTMSGCTGSSWNIPAGRRPSGREYAHCDRIRGPGPSLKCFSSRTHTAAISG